MAKHTKIVKNVNDVNKLFFPSGVFDCPVSEFIRVTLEFKRNTFCGIRAFQRTGTRD